jgi:L-amino acid N-acyltransferase YncA
MAELDLVVRNATASDAQAMLDIYRPIVEHTAISFEETPPDVQEFTDRIIGLQSTHPWIAAEHDGSVVGFAYAAPHRVRAGYRFSVETTVYVASEMQGMGVGRALYGVLIDRLVDAGFASAFAGIALPNPASVRLHEAVGFTRTGTFPRVGYKLGRWHDVGWWYLPLDR